MNSIILNGVSSTTIAGLLIQSLPPISKPLMRTQVDEVDGRDGDIVTKLGYSAYDKQILIGLYGSFSIDEVIAFFNSEGTVTFSNEPTKFYNFQIIQQIDFERLLRYRTATVTFHVQPFKYATNNDTIDETFSAGDAKTMSVTNSGNVASKPAITIYGSGDIVLSLNGIQAFSIALGSTGNITIDVEQMEAYSGTTLRNRLVTGDYANMTMPVGANTLTWTGSVTEITITRFSRWL